MHDDIIRQLAELEKMPYGELKQKWVELFGGEPPGYNRRFLIKRLAHRIQERAYGGLKPETRSTLERLLEEEGYDDIGRPVEAPKPRNGKIVPGTMLVRYYKEQRHVVTVLEDGFEYQGQPHKSLSSIARQITGTRWNGPAFFGLRKNGQAEVKQGESDGK